MSQLPVRYTAGLTEAQAAKQTALIAESASEYKRKGIVSNRPRVSHSATPRSIHVARFERNYGFSPANHVKVKQMFPDTDVDKILAKGAAAYASGSRPNVTIAQWANARLASVLTGGPALKVDGGLVGPISMRKIQT